ncbi:MAG: hypothetical protein G3H99_04160 [Ferrovum sp.]|nr:hypothetical protein [Ferrovum sp.]NDU87829.1 hypothetical protein [Ferrovum sp.]
MGATQVRHAKLWFAGTEGNWDLAAYEVGELREGLDDAAQFDAMFKNIPLNYASLRRNISCQTGVSI